MNFIFTKCVNERQSFMFFPEAKRHFSWLYLSFTFSFRTNSQHKSEHVNQSVNQLLFIKRLVLFVSLATSLEESKCLISPRLVEHYAGQKSKKQYSPHLQACPYIHSDGKRTSCDLEATVNDEIRILFNGTLNNKLVRNTFSARLTQNGKQQEDEPVFKLHSISITC